MTKQPHNICFPSVGLYPYNGEQPGVGILSLAMSLIAWASYFEEKKKKHPGTENTEKGGERARPLIKGICLGRCG